MFDFDPHPPSRHYPSYFPKFDVIFFLIWFGFREVFVWISYMASIDSRSIESEDEDGGNVRHFDLLQEKKW